PEADPDNRLRDRPTVPGEPPNPVNVPTGCRFHPRCPQFMAGQCDVVEPELIEARPGRYVACHLFTPMENADGPVHPSTGSGRTAGAGSGRTEGSAPSNQTEE
ncbi:MAG: hypothetical protein OXN15_07760, partial [Chloroflexota bacterium]|nr:hypothetical protein [Chloroflexota bacterium]